MIKCVVPVSGGKDSQACLDLATRHFKKDEILGLFCDTKFEHPLTYRHIDFMRELYEVAIENISDGNVITRCLRWGRFPNGASRFCTDELKIKPTKRFLENLAADQGCGFEVWYGMRQNESAERRKRYADRIATELYAMHEILPTKYPKHLAAMGVMAKLPIVDWTDGEVFDFLQGRHNPLYYMGFDRVGCFPCLASGDAWKIKAFQYDETGEKHYEMVKLVQARTGKNVFTSKNMTAQGCLLCAI